MFLASARGVIIPSDGRFPYGPIPPVAVGTLPTLRFSTTLGFPATLARPVEPFSRPEYSYGYDVNYPLTGDSKTQHETRDGDGVRGGYSFIESDGSRRIVDYFSDSVNGFNAIVRKEPAVAKPAPVVEARPAAVAVVRPTAPILVPGPATVSPVTAVRPASVAVVRPAAVAPVFVPKPAAVYPVVATRPVAVVKPAAVAAPAVGVSPLAIRFHPSAAAFAPLPFVLGRHGYGYPQTPFGFPYY